VAFYTDNGIAKPQDEIRESVVRAASLLDASGISVVEDKPACLVETLEIFFDLFYADGCYSVEQLLLRYGTTTPHPWLSAFMESARERAFSGPKFSDLMLRWDGFRRAMLEFMRNYDLILCPPFASTAFEHDRWNQDGIVQGFSYTQSYNLCGWPALVLPCGFSSAGLPIGVQIVAKPWKEHEAIAMGGFIEERLAGDRPQLFQS
jgi:amidase